MQTQRSYRYGGTPNVQAVIGPRRWAEFSEVLPGGVPTGPQRGDHPAQQLELCADFGAASRELADIIRLLTGSIEPRDARFQSLQLAVENQPVGVQLGQCVSDAGPAVNPRDVAYRLHKSRPLGRHLELGRFDQPQYRASVARVELVLEGRDVAAHGYLGDAQSPGDLGG